LTDVETESFSGYIWPQLLDVFPGQPIVERTSMNSWDDAGFRKAIEATEPGRQVREANRGGLLHRQRAGFSPQARNRDSDELSLAAIDRVSDLPTGTPY